jgi:hypothetical protein
MPKFVARHWKSKFARFIQSYGVESLAAELDVRPSAIYHWIRGAASPRPSHAEIIQRLAQERRCRLTMDQIYEHTRLVRADHIAFEAGTPRGEACGGSPRPQLASRV